MAGLCDDCGALAAALVDGEGETVDYAGLLSPYDIKVLAAEWRIVLAVLHDSRLAFSHVTTLTVRAKGAQLLHGGRRTTATPSPCACPGTASRSPAAP